MNTTTQRLHDAYRQATTERNSAYSTEMWMFECLQGWRGSHPSPTPAERAMTGALEDALDLCLEEYYRLLAEEHVARDAYYAAQTKEREEEHKKWQEEMARRKAEHDAWMKEQAAKSEARDAERKARDAEWKKQQEEWDKQQEGQKKHEAPKAIVSQYSAACGMLGLSLQFTKEELRAAYRKAALANNPDKGGNTATMQAINAAHDYLKK